MGPVWMTCGFVILYDKVDSAAVKSKLDLKRELPPTHGDLTLSHKL